MVIGEGEVELRVLGPLACLIGGVERPVRGGRKRAILCALASAPNQQLSTDHILDLVWGERWPQTGVRALRVHISELRSQLQAYGASELIETTHSGYQLGTCRVDLDRFRTALSDAQIHFDHGRFGPAIDRASTALSQWRGPALVELRDSTAIHVVRVSLVEDRRRAEDVLARSWLESGRPPGRIIGRLAGC